MGLGGGQGGWSGGRVGPGGRLEIKCLVGAQHSVLSAEASAQHSVLNAVKCFKFAVHSVLSACGKALYSVLSAKCSLHCVCCGKSHL